MFVEIIRCLQDNFSYLLIDKKKNHACVIDPGESNPIIKFLVIATIATIGNLF